MPDRCECTWCKIDVINKHKAKAKEVRDIAYQAQEEIAKVLRFFVDYGIDEEYLSCHVLWHLQKKIDKIEKALDDMAGV
jgi:hypothetical protein